MNHKADKLLWVMIGLYVLVLGLVSSLRHYNFETQAYDLGIFDQSFWNAIHGRGLTNTLETTRNHLGVHMSPGLFLLVPGYALFPSPYYLLIIQTLALGLGAWPLYLLARKVLGDYRLALLIASGYLLYPSLHWINFYDFHEIAFFVPLLLAALYFVEMQKWPLAAGFLALSASVKEDAVLVVLFVGIYLLAKRPPKFKFGLAVAALALAYFLLAALVLMPAMGGGLLHLNRYSRFGQNFAEIIWNIIISPATVAQTIFTADKLLYLLWLLLPLAFLPLLGAFSAWLLLVPGLAENLLTDYRPQFSTLYQYDAILLPGLWLGAIYGLQLWLKKYSAKGFLIKIFVLTIFLTGFVLRSPLSVWYLAGGAAADTSGYDAVRKQLELIPREASVSASPKLVPHLSQRAEIYLFGREPYNPDFVVVDRTHFFTFGSTEAFETYLRKYQDSQVYEEKKIDGRFVMFVKTRL